MERKERFLIAKNMAQYIRDSLIQRGEFGQDVSGPQLVKNAERLGIIKLKKMKEPCCAECMCETTFGSEAFPLNCYVFHKAVDNPDDWPPPTLTKEDVIEYNHESMIDDVNWINRNIPKINQNFYYLSNVLGVDLLKLETGTVPNDGTGDSIRVAAEKINANFDLVREALREIARVTRRPQEKNSDR